MQSTFRRFAKKFCLGIGNMSSMPKKSEACKVHFFIQDESSNRNKTTLGVPKRNENTRERAKRAFVARLKFQRRRRSALHVLEDKQEYICGSQGSAGKEKKVALQKLFNLLHSQSSSKTEFLTVHSLTMGAGRCQAYSVFVYPDLQNGASVLWEDDDTGSKCVRVNWLYSPTDIPEVVGRPTTPEKDEVYESNHGDNNLVGSIQGPCQVLSSEKYRDEIEKRRELLKGGPEIGAFHPIFLC
ncbi:hypothetical protein KI387_023782, partial [Taxus chinensis]